MRKVWSSGRFLQKFASYIGGSWVRISPQDKKNNANTSHICSFRNGVCFYRRIRRIAGMRTEAPSPDVRIADRPCGLHRRFGYRRFLVSPVRPIAGFVLEALSPEFPSPEPHIAGRSIAGRFLMCYRRVSKSGDEIRRYQATSILWSAAAEGFCSFQFTRGGEGGYKIGPCRAPLLASCSWLLGWLFPYVLAHDPVKAPAVENFAWLPVGAVSTKTGRGSVSLI